LPIICCARRAFADYHANQRQRLDIAGEGRAQDAGARVGISLPHESAVLHVTGSATYTDDMPELAGTLHARWALARGRRAPAGDRPGRGARHARRGAGHHRRRHPGVNDCGSAVPTTPSCATATSATWASRCSPSSPHARCGRRAAALAKVLRVEAAGPC
jgi:xanthine dehydrogenase large subunit